MSPFGTLPQYGIDYWPKNAKIIQIEADPRRIGLVKTVDVGINGDCKLASQELLKQVRKKTVNSFFKHPNSYVEQKNRYSQPKYNVDIHYFNGHYLLVSQLKF